MLQHQRPSAEVGAPACPLQSGPELWKKSGNYLAGSQGLQKTSLAVAETFWDIFGTSGSRDILGRCFGERERDIYIYMLFKFSSYKMGVSMNSWFLVTGVFILRKRFLNTFKVQISSFKVRVLAFKVQTLSAIPLRSPF